MLRRLALLQVQFDSPLNGVAGVGVQEGLVLPRCLDCREVSILWVSLHQVEDDGLLLKSQRENIESSLQAMKAGRKEGGGNLGLELVLKHRHKGVYKAEELG